MRGVAVEQNGVAAFGFSCEDFVVLPLALGDHLFSLFSLFSL
jgi:hypothetical protein